MKMRCNGGSSGFTLIEIVIVIAIIAVLATVAIPAYKRHLAKAKFVSAFTLLRNITGRALLSLAENGTCLPKGATYGQFIPIPLEYSKVVSAYAMDEAGAGYEGCVVRAAFRAVDEGGYAGFADKRVKIHAVRVSGTNNHINIDCITNVGKDVFNYEDIGCRYYDPIP